MKRTLEFDTLTLNANADGCRPAPGGFILSGAYLTLGLPAVPKSYYRHGWQSWSLAAWQDPALVIPTPRPAILHPMQTDPVYVHDPHPNGSWIGAVEFGDGNVLLLGALGLGTHVRLDGRELHAWNEAGTCDWFAVYGPEPQAFADYAAQLGQRFGKGRAESTLRVWCSWYSLYTEIDEQRLLDILAELDRPFDVFQIDDGWQRSIGDWEANEKFPSGMDGIAARIREIGRRAGLWLAPLLVVPSSELYRRHRDWLLRDEKGKLVSAGFNWNEPLYALDTTHPEALDWLAGLMKKVRGWGYDYIKLDFLYAGALEGKRHTDTPREQAYRQGLGVIREALGEAYFLACGAPVVPSIGLCDALRVGPDVAGHWDSPRDDLLLRNPTTPGTRNAIRTTVNRLWLAPLVHTDPDVAYFTSRNVSLSDGQKRLLQDLALVCDYKATSDLPGWLDQSQGAALAGFLANRPRVERSGRYTFTLDGRPVDFSPAMPLPGRPSTLQKISGALLGWAASKPLVLKVNNWLEKRTLKKTLE
ncbi:MAG: glycoside hydrolase family 36 protein [Chloroflexota bacterium]